MTRTLAIALAIVACGPARRARPPQRIVVRDAGVDASDAAIEAGPDKLALLVARQGELAPGARQVTSVTIDASREHEVALPKLEAATCVRAAFDADAPTAITLVNARGRTLASADGAEGVIGANGPVCLRGGDVATFRIAGQSRVRIVVWATP